MNFVIKLMSLINPIPAIFSGGESGPVPPPPSHFRVTDTDENRITDDGSFRITDN